MSDAPGVAAPHAGLWRQFAALFREGARHQPEGGWTIPIAVGAVAAALYVLWIGALSTIVGDLAGWLARDLKAAGIASVWLEDFSTWARAFSAQYHLDISVFIAITFPIAFLTTTARESRKTLSWTDIALAAIAFAIAL